MRFMMLILPKGYENAKPDAMPEAKAVEAMMKFNKSLQEAGVLIAIDGLHPPSQGVRVSFSNGKPKAVSGPFPGTKGILGGYWMINAGSKEEAVEWAKKIPASDGDIVEIRQVQEIEDFPKDIQEVTKDFRDMQARK